MLLGNQSLMAILHQWEGPEPESPEWAGQTLQYFYMVLTKVAMNSFLLAFTRCALSRSFMGVSFLSLCLADLLLAATLATAALMGRHPDDDPFPTAFLLTHASCIYAFLPLPLLTLGVLDLGSTHWERGGERRAGGQVGAVFAVWVAACFYSAWRTDPSVLEVALRRRPMGLLQVCEVQASQQVTLFCLALIAALVITLLPHLPDVPRCMAHINRLMGDSEGLLATMEPTHDSESVLISPATPSDPSVSSVDTHNNLLLLQQRERERERRCPPLYLSCVLLYAMQWSPYLLLHLSSELLQLAVPSYASVNTLWLSCANSLLVGATYWRHQSGHQGGHQRGHQRGHQNSWSWSARSLDAICDWRIAGYLSYHGNSSRASPQQHNLPLELQSPPDRKLKPLVLL